MNRLSHILNKKSILFILCLTPLIGFSIWNVITIYKDAKQREQIRTDYSQINSLTFGMLSVRQWEEKIKDIIKKKIENFSLTEREDSLLQEQLTVVLNDVVSKANEMFQESDTTFKRKLKAVAFNVFIDNKQVHSLMPGFSQTIINDLTKEKNKKRLKNLAIHKLNQYMEQTHDTSGTEQYNHILEKYDSYTRNEFNKKAEREMSELKHKAYILVYIQVGIVALLLILWLIIYKRFSEYVQPFYFVSVLIALIVLMGGLLCPMIEIDARMKELDFVLLGEHIKFQDQILFYRSKSILGAVLILMTNKGIDTIAVGLLIFAFSVMVPVGKLVCSEIFLLGSDKLRKNKVVHYMAFKSGKWSMADVTVIAIFMSYSGFKGMLVNQLKDLNVQKQSLTILSTSHSTLQPGYILFIAFVVFSLVLSVMLSKSTSGKQI